MLHVRDLGVLPYREAWAVQEEVHAAVASGDSPPTLLLVEHPPVITFGRRAEESAKHLVASTDMLSQMGVDVVESDRGGDITFHGPGQLVAYPILRLVDFKLSVGGYMRRLQEGVIATCESFYIPAGIDPCAVGVWAPVSTPLGPDVGKLCATGVRVKQGTTLHGIALNVTTDLSYFDLIVPCGLTGRPVTSLQRLLGDSCPRMADLKPLIARELSAAISRDKPRDNLRVYTSNACAT